MTTIFENANQAIRELRPGCVVTFVDRYEWVTVDTDRVPRSEEIIETVTLTHPCTRSAATGYLWVRGQREGVKDDDWHEPVRYDLIRKVEFPT